MSHEMDEEKNKKNLKIKSIHSVLFTKVYHYTERHCILKIINQA